MNRTATLDPDNAAAGLDQVRRWPSAGTKDWTARFVLACVESVGVVAVVAYGSAVRDVERSGDLDLLFVFEGESLESEPPLDVDLRGYATHEVDSLLSMGHDVLGWAVRFGAVLWQRDAWWDDLTARWVDRLPLPSAAAADARAARASRLSRELAAAGDADAAGEMHVTVLTQRARAELIRAGVFPRSRPELPRQLRAIGGTVLARELSDALARQVA